MGLIYWVLIGLVEGWLAGRVIKGNGYGVWVDIALGIVSGIGGWLLTMAGLRLGIIGSILLVFVGATFLVWITRLVKKG